MLVAAFWIGAATFLLLPWVTSAVLLGLLADSRRHYEAAPAAAKQLVAVGEFPRPTTLDVAEHAAWLCVCNALLNLDEALTKE